MHPILKNLSIDEQDLFVEFLRNDGYALFTKKVLPDMLNMFIQQLLSCHTSELHAERAKYEGAKQLTTRLSKLREEVLKHELP